MACRNDNCRFMRYCRRDVSGYVEEEDCAEYWKLEEIAEDAEREREAMREEDDYEEDEEEEKDDR